jgi:hypothetical protein
MNAYQPFNDDGGGLFDTPMPDPHFDKYEPANPSRAAKESIKEALPELRAKVFEFIKAQGERGCTDEQIQDGLPMEPNTERPRRYELVKMGRVVDSGRRRPLKSGKSGTVWVAQ